jgi:hypothetical protein
MKVIVILHIFDDISNKEIISQSWK